MLQLGRETQVEALGKQWTVARAELPVLRLFVEWIKDQLGDPFAGIEKELALYKELLPPEEYKAKALERIKEAKDEADAIKCMDINSPIISKWMSSVTGAMKLLHLMLKVNHPEVTEGEAARVFSEIGVAKAMEAIADGNGKLPEGNAGALAGTGSASA